MGGATPAALGADWIATVLDQLAYAWVSSPLAVRLEQVVLAWLGELFDLPPGWLSLAIWVARRSERIKFWSQRPN